MVCPFEILLVLLGVFLLRYAMTSEGGTRYSQISGGMLCLVAALWAWRLFGWAPWFAYLAFFLLVTLPIAEIVLARMLNKSDQYWL